MTRRSLLSTLPLLAIEADTMALLERAITLDEANLERMRSYVFDVTDVFTPARGPVASQKFEVNLVGGSMYWRKLAQDGRPLTDRLATEEQNRLAAHLRQSSVAPSSKWREEREVLKRWLGAHQFRTTGRKQVDGRRAILIETKPGTEFEANLAYFTAANGRLVIDEETGHWIRADFEAQQQTEYAMFQLLYGRLSLPYSPGLINRGNLSKSAKFSFALRLTTDGLWAPRFQRIEARTHRSELSFGEFRRFTSDSQLLLDPA